MRRTWRLTLTLLRDWGRNRQAVFFTFLFPVVLLLVFGFVFAGGTTEFDVAVQNNDVGADGEPTELSAALVTAIEAADPLVVEHVDPDRDLGEVDDLERETGHRRVVVVPEGFDERVRQRSGRVRAAVIRDTLERIGTDAGGGRRNDVATDLQGIGTPGPTRDGPVQVTLITTPNDDAGGAIASVLDSVVARFNDRSIGVEEPTAEVTTERRGDAAPSGADYFLPAFVVATILINGVMTVPSAVAELERDGTMKRLAATPLRKHEWILANVLQQSILAVLVTGVLVAVARLVFDVTAVPGPLAIAMVVLGAVAFTALGMALAGVIRDPGSAISLGGVVVFPLLFGSGVFWQLDLMPSTLQRAAEFSPVTHFHRSLRHLLVLDSTRGVATTFAVLGMLALAFLAAAVSLTRWREFE